jgi:hypothetical protein
MVMEEVELDVVEDAHVDRASRIVSAPFAKRTAVL